MPTSFATLQNLRALIEQTTAGADTPYAITNQDDYIFANRPLLQWLGLEDVTRISEAELQTFFTAASKEQLKDALGKIEATRQPQSLPSCRLKNNYGESYTFTLQLFRFATLEKVHLVYLFQDVSKPASQIAEDHPVRKYIDQQPKQPLTIEEVRQNVTTADYEQLVNEALGGIWFIDIQEGREYNSPGFWNLLGYEAGDFNSWKQVLLEEDYSAAEMTAEAYAKSGPKRAHRAVFRYRARDKSIKHILNVGQTLKRDEAGRPLMAFGFFVDITEQVQLQRRLAQTMRSLQVQRNHTLAMFNALPEIVMIADKTTGKVIDCNDEAVYKTGYERTELIGMHYSSLHPKGEQEIGRQYFFRNDARLMRIPNVTLITKDGKTFPTTFSRTISELDGKAVYISIFSDLSKLREAQQRLADSEQRYRQIIEHSSDYITISNHRFEKEWVSKNMVTELGYSREAMIGKTMKDYVHPDDIPLLEKVFDEDLKAGKDRVRFRCRIKKADGSYITTESTSVFLTDENGLPKIYTYRKDVTKEEELERQREEMAQLKSEFVSMASHQLRTPMAVFSANLELLEQLPEAKQPPFDRILKRLMRESDRMVNLVDEVLLVSRIDEGTMEGADRQPLDLYEFLQDICHEGLCQSDTKPITLRLDCQPGEAIVTVDEAHIQHILLNLISNAQKYTPPDSRMPEVTLSVKETQHALIRVQDYGIGIPEEDQAKLFAQFRRGSNVKNIPGTGLGLYVVKRFANLNDIQLRLESQIKQGTRIDLYIPITE